MTAAQAAGVRSFVLIENHNLDGSGIEPMDSGLPEAFAMDWDHLIFYHYPKGCEKPEQGMRVLAGHLALAATAGAARSTSRLRLAAMTFRRTA